MSSLQRSPRRRTGSRNVRTLVATDVETDGRKHPRLGKRDDGARWHPKVKRWWADLWTSAAVADIDQSDHLAVWMLADLHHRRLTTNAPTEIARLSTEARNLAASLGLSPRARSVAKVELASAERADAERRKRRNRSAVTAVETPPATGETLTTEDMLARVRSAQA